MESQNTADVRRPDSHSAVDTEAKRPFKLMSLPVEIRQLILIEAICLPLDPPACPSVSQHDRRCLTPGKRRGRFWQVPLVNPALALLLVNRQLLAEVKGILRFVPERYHLDVMFVKSHGLWTTWSLSRQPQAQYIDTVTCTFRPFEPTADLDGRFNRSISFVKPCCGKPPTGFWYFYGLLATLFDRGPGFCPEVPGRSRYVVGTIVINVAAPTDGAPHSSFSLPEGKWLELPPEARIHAESRKEGKTIEETLALFLLDRFRYLVQQGYDADNYGMFLWECLLNRAVFMVNGKEVEVFDMEQICQNHVPDKWGGSPYSIEERKKRWGVWRAWVLERRRKLREGLVVEDDNPQPRII